MSNPESFADNESRVFSLLVQAGFSPRVIYDIGAAQGTWSALISQIFPAAEFHMFEPLASLVPAFREGLEWQMQRHPTFTLHPVALGSENKPVAMRIHEDGYSSTIMNMGEHPEYQQRHNVAGHRLDDFVADRSLPLPDLVKLDVQGAEREILEHASRCLEHAQLVFAETWFVRGYGPDTPLLTELVTLLDKHGFDLAEIGHRFYDSGHRLYGCDAFFLKRTFLRDFAPSLPPTAW